MKLASVLTPLSETNMRLDAPERGGAKVTAFNLADARRAMSLNSRAEIASSSIGAADLWIHLERFLREVIPVAEASGVTLAVHPDDPPLKEHGPWSWNVVPIESIPSRPKSISPQPVS